MHDLIQKTACKGDKGIIAVNLMSHSPLLKSCNDSSMGQTHHSSLWPEFVDRVTGKSGVASLCPYCTHLLPSF